MFGIIYENIFSATEKFMKCLIFIIPFIMVTIYYASRQNLRISKLHILGELIFTYLIVYILDFTTISSLARILYIGIEIRPETFNFIPFKSIKTDVFSYITNIILFIPFGFLCSTLWKNQRSVKHVALGGFLFSLTIETSQIFSMRVTDVDDLLMNTIGTIIGYLIFRIIQKFSAIKNSFVLVGYSEIPFVLKHEVWFLIYIVFAFEFLILPYLS
ncbi:VanZ family protein [Aminipila sp.]|uniref:VanZ family protein n=1 Tax=Aminipila sp. TaxID=2060095 RepID=UPI0028A2DD38|nr:VanZ family protein [Aminipila sp.]